MRELKPMSRAGYNKLMTELNRLEKVELPEVRATVAQAREEGDLKENGAYIYGRIRQGEIEGRISELKGKLNRADIVDCTKINCDRAGFGTIVSLLDLNTKEKVTYQLLGPDEADFDTGSISIDSPIGRTIINQAIGDKIVVKVPRGDRHLEVINISRPEVD
jgi:transcription elongation factor GreA